VRRDTYGRFFSCLVFVPRDRYNTLIRERMQDILLKAFDGVNVEYNVRLSESVLARVHFTIYTKPGETPEYDEEEIEGRIVATTRSWTDNLYDALIEHFGEERGTELFRKYRDAFPPGYRAGFLPRTAVSDIQRMETLKSEDDLGMSLYHPIEESEDFLGFKLFRLGEQVSLSEILPLLEDMGVEVVDERPHEVKPAGSPPVWIYDFGLVHETGDELQTGEVKEIFQDAPDLPGVRSPSSGPTASTCARPARRSPRTTWRTPSSTTTTSVSSSWISSRHASTLRARTKRRPRASELPRRSKKPSRRS
jgi:glutamate dehydrogenase